MQPNVVVSGTQRLQWMQATSEMGHDPLSRESTTFIVLSFEGPDVYARAGGLGVRVTELSRALADAGYPVHLVFVGDPGLPGHEELIDGRLMLHRWCQWISAFHPEGVYAGEEGKWRDFSSSTVDFVVDQLARPAIKAGHRVVILSEEWHTAEALCRIGDRLWQTGLRKHAVLLWNANNTMGFDRIDWPRLNFATTITTVSRYMKHIMWTYGVDPLVIPNGIPTRWLDALPDESADCVRHQLGEGPFLVKVARWDPDKRWMLALETVAYLKEADRPARLIARGGVEAHGGEVLDYARALGLRVRDVNVARSGIREMAEALGAAAESADILNVTSFIPPEDLRVLYRAADGVLANSGREPFGLVGLEAMAAGGTAFTGNTGEEYARHLENAVVLDTADPAEAAWYVSYLAERPGEQERLRAEGRATARTFTWDRVLEQLLSRIKVLAAAQD
jgi:glycosyltransferase involved in cell wall biosynthesis